jgi:hypothetical protein
MLCRLLTAFAGDGDRRDGCVVCRMARSRADFILVASSERADRRGQGARLTGSARPEPVNLISASRYQPRHPSCFNTRAVAANSMHQYKTVNVPFVETLMAARGDEVASPPWSVRMLVSVWRGKAKVPDRSLCQILS